MTSKPTLLSPRLRAVLEIVALIVFILLCARLLWDLQFGRAAPNRPAVPDRSARQPPAPLPTEPLTLAGAAVKGSSSAKVGMIVYSEFQCPYCGVFANDRFRELERDYVSTGLMIFAFRHFPLATIHPFATKAAESAECAGRQGRFWEMHDMLFENSKDLAPDSLKRRAGTLGLDLKKFAKCLNGEAAARVAEDLAFGRSLGVTGTPTFFFGTVTVDGRVAISKRLSGAQPVEQFRVVLDELLALRLPTPK